MHMASRLFLCLVAACCLFYLLALLPPPGQGRRPAGLAVAAAGAGFGGRRLLHLLPVPEPRFFVPTQAAAVEEQRGEPVTKKARRPAWAWSVTTTAPELRAVPGGPDPLHHHGGSPSSRRPDQDHRTPSP